MNPYTARELSRAYTRDRIAGAESARAAREARRASAERLVARRQRATPPPAALPSPLPTALPTPLPPLVPALPTRRRRWSALWPA